MNFQEQQQYQQFTASTRMRTPPTASSYLALSDIVNVGVGGRADMIVVPPPRLTTLESPIAATTTNAAAATATTSTIPQLTSPPQYPASDRGIQQAVAVAAALSRAQQAHSSRLGQMVATLNRVQQVNAMRMNLMGSPTNNGSVESSTALNGISYTSPNPQSAQQQLHHHQQQQGFNLTHQPLSQLGSSTSSPNGQWGQIHSRRSRGPRSNSVGSGGVGPVRLQSSSLFHDLNGMNGNETVAQSLRSAASSNVFSSPLTGAAAATTLTTNSTGGIGAAASVVYQRQIPLSSTTIPRNGTVNPSVHPQFRSKVVCKIHCSHCYTEICKRGMKAILLGNTKVELYSTDTPPSGVQLVYQDYTTQNCLCRIRDGACLGCGNVVGYHVTQPCEGCLEACNNGHFWMFHAEGVSSVERMDDSGNLMGVKRGLIKIS